MTTAGGGVAAPGKCMMYDSDLPARPPERAAGVAAIVGWYRSVGAEWGIRPASLLYQSTISGDSIPGPTLDMLKFFNLQTVTRFRAGVGKPMSSVSEAGGSARCGAEYLQYLGLDTRQVAPGMCSCGQVDGVSVESWPASLL